VRSGTPNEEREKGKEKKVETTGKKERWRREKRETGGGRFRP